MELGPYFKDFIEYHKRFNTIKIVIERSEPKKEFAKYNNFLEQLERFTKELKEMKDNVKIKRYEVDHRGFFKKGHAKRELDKIITVHEIDTLLDQIQAKQESLRQDQNEVGASIP